MLGRLVVAAVALAAHAAAASPSLRVVFEENRGQAPPDAAFVARGRDHVLRIGVDGATFVGSDGQSVVGMRFAGALPGAVRGEERLSGVVNDLRGTDPARWLRDVPTYGSVVREGAWPGIDVVFHAGAGRMEHDFRVAPGADSGAIRLELEGAPSACVDADGSLVVTTASGEMRFERPVAWELSPAGAKRPVQASFAIDADSAVRFDVRRIDASAPLVVDPVVSFASYLGGSDDESIGALAAGPNGDVAIAGMTSSSDYLTASPHQGTYLGVGDAVVTRLDPLTGTVRWSTYFGGTATDRAEAVAFDRFGNVVVGGATASGDFPTLQAAHGSPSGMNDGFVAKFNRTGTLLFSTYVGGTDADEVVAIATGEAGDVYFGGDTQSTTTFPTVAPRQSASGGGDDGFVGRMTAAGVIQWLTFHGGDGSDTVEGLSVGGDGALTITGGTSSSNLPLQREVQGSLIGGNDAYVSALSTDGTTLQFSTYLGGAGFDFGNAVARTALGDSFVTGFTDSPNFPLTAALDSTFSNGEAFVVRMTPLGAVTWSTYLGGTDSDFGNDIGLDPSGNPVIFGNTSSNDLTLTAATQVAYAGSGDVFVTKLAADGASRLFSTYVGGASADSARGGAVDPGGFMSFAGITYDTGFPTVSPIQAAFASAPPGTGADGIIGTIASGSAGDLDADGVADTGDTCPRIPNPLQDDRDGDARGDACDNCRLYANVTQADADGDVIGDACEFEYGDVAPLAAPDGTLDIADVVFALRTSVGLETPTSAQLDAMDVAPYDLFPGPPDFAAPNPAATRAVDIADVVAMLRGSVGLVSFTDPF